MAGLFDPDHPDRIMVSDRVGDLLGQTVAHEMHHVPQKGADDDIATMHMTRKAHEQLGNGKSTVYHDVTAAEMEADFGVLKEAVFRDTKIDMNSPEVTCEVFKAMGAKLDPAALKKLGLENNPPLPTDKLKILKDFPQKYYSAQRYLEIINGGTHAPDAIDRIQHITPNVLPPSTNNPDYHYKLLRQIFTRIPCIARSSPKIDYSPLNFDTPAKGIIQHPDIGEMS